MGIEQESSSKIEWFSKEIYMDFIDKLVIISYEHIYKGGK